ncbi:UNVERIFIED_CONTAM: hypothetical protein Slati_2450100 [Sesamum latifolium]|uniref:Uncharacterized protein n=1 Tax=Sesamum latifolium TaxID=2727402 RepID=A0AAW2WEL4_9LAMI
MGLKPVATRQPTLFPPPVRAPRRAIRSIISSPLDSELAPPLLLTNPNAEDDGGAPPPRVLEAPLHIGVPHPISPVLGGGGDTNPRPKEATVTTGDTSAAVHDLFVSPAVVGEGGHTHASQPKAEDASAVFILVPIPNPTSHIYVGNVPLTMNSQCFDKIAEGFHNSSRKTLSFVPPTMQNGEIIVRPSLDVIRDGAKRWSTTAVGYFLGKRPYFHHVNEFVRSIWPLVREVKRWPMVSTSSSSKQRPLWRRLWKEGRGCFSVSPFSCRNGSRV